LICPGRAFLAGLSTNGDVCAGFRAVACIHVNAIGIQGARELAIRFAAGICTVSSAEVAIFADLDLCIATAWSLARAILTSTGRHAAGICWQVIRYAHEHRIACIGLANLCGGTIGRWIDTRTRAIRVATVAVGQIAVVADFAGFKKTIATDSRRANADFANTARNTRHAIR
jgi:hypothetical protein